MGLFGKQKRELPPLMTAADFDEVGNYESSLAYLCGLSDAEYKKVIEVSGIHRKALQDSANVLGQPLEPTTFITEPEPVSEPTDEPNFLDDLVDDKKKSKGKHIEVKD